MLPDGFSAGKIKPFFLGLVLGGWDLLHPMFPFPVLYGVTVCPLGFSSSWCVKSFLTHSKQFFSYCNPPNGPPYKNPLSCDLPAPGAPSETVCAALWGSGGWLERTELSQLLKPMAPAWGLQQQHLPLSL